MPFLAPLWLLALVALALPLWLHLRDRRPPDIVLVGSTADLVAGPAVTQRRRLREPLLLMLRLALLALIIAALATPVRVPPASPGRVVAVVPGDLPLFADSLRATGLPALSPSRSLAPWVALEAAVALTTIDDTLRLVAPAGRERWLGPRPVIDRAVIVANPEAADGRPPLTQILPRRPLPSDSTPSPRSIAPLFWWLALGVLTTERILAHLRIGRR